MKVFAIIVSLLFSNLSFAGQRPCTNKDFNSIKAALKSRKLEKGPETKGHVATVQGMLSQENQIGVTCQVIYPDMPGPSIPSQKVDRYLVSHASQGTFEIVVSTNPVERGDRLTITRL